MSALWRNWLRVWCGSVALFGLVIAAGAVPALSGPIRAALDLLNGPDGLTIDGPMRFALAVLGCVTIGWAATLHVAIQAAHLLGAEVWRGVTLSVLIWYATDSCLSVATGFALNVLPNTLFLAAYLLPLLASGVLRDDARLARA